MDASRRLAADGASRSSRAGTDTDVRTLVQCGVRCAERPLDLLTELRPRRSVDHSPAARIRFDSGVTGRLCSGTLPQEPRDKTRSERIEQAGLRHP